MEGAVTKPSIDGEALSMDTRPMERAATESEPLTERERVSLTSCRPCNLFPSFQLLRNIVPAADWLVSLDRCALSQPDARDNVASDNVGPTRTRCVLCLPNPVRQSLCVAGAKKCKRTHCQCSVPEPHPYIKQF
ncbi:hypothetical protein Ddc_17932 [Ditylenchus destructor]|nr:hypothetical protein Ddc_17932 [Ditylenchus destructor]